MYNVSAPINIRQLNENTLPVYLESLRQCGATRVFICGIGFTYQETDFARTHPRELQRYVDYFKENGLEVGFWIGAFGHGFALLPFIKLDYIKRYQQMEGINGQKPQQAICPLDENFAADFAAELRLLASFHPDLIMLDDDFRINARKRAYYFGCFCPLHLKEYYRRLGGEVPREEIEERIFTGGENKYRTVYLELMRDSLLGFARKMREAVDTVDKTIRLGACSTYESWDHSGTTPVEIARALAGDTKPFTRMAGAPYWAVGWNRNFLSILETDRQQYAWGKGSGVEFFSEGDLFPRTRFVIPAKLLETFDLAHVCAGSADGILAYLYDYETPPDYEDGYARSYAKNSPRRKRLLELFAGKQAAGVRVFSVPHKIRRWELPSELIPDISEIMERTPASPAAFILARNTIPTTYEASELPVLLYGENARYIPEAELANGAILDLVAAGILESRGIDTGLADAESSGTSKSLDATRIVGKTREFFPGDNVSIPNVAASPIRRIACKPGAEILSTFVPENTPASYYYENARGQKFLVIAYDHYAANLTPNPHFENSYCRQKEIITAVERMAGRRLPAVCPKHPDLYLLAAKGEGSMAVALFNLHADDVQEPEIRLDRCYREIRPVGCTGTLSGDRVRLSDIPPFGIAAFEVLQ